MIAMTDVHAVGTASPRHAFVGHLLERLDGRCGWAFQGAGTAVDDWAAADDLHDLDIWVERRHACELIDAVRRAGAHPVRAHHDARRLSHEQWWLPDGGQGAIVDITVGDLRVGPLLLCPEYLATTVRTADGVRRLAGGAAAIDLAVRPLLRGRLVTGARLAEARAAWATEQVGRRDAIRAHVRAALGSDLAADVVAWLDGTDPRPDLVARTRRVLLRATLSPGHLPSTWADRRAIVPTRRPGPLGFRQRGVVIALVGTDGSGKSTLATHVADTLTSAGYEVDHAYFGMARNNLPGLGAIRRLMRGSDEHAVAARPATAPTPGARIGIARRIGAWVYAVDYTWRGITKLGPARRRRRVVIADRWVTDLRRSPAPGSPAAAVAERLVGPPDVFVLADAPAEVIAARKSERTLDEIRAEQTALRATIAAYDGRRRGARRCHAMIADTAQPVQESVEAIVAAVVAAAHR